MSERTVLVTGAASGIGRATALGFAARGWRVGAFDIDPGVGRMTGPRMITGTLDVRDAAQWEAALALLTETSGGRLDALVNNAGILQSGAFVDIPLADQQRTVEVNVIGVLNGCHTAHRYLKATPGSHVVNLCSASAIYGQPELATYSATKFAVRGLSEALDLEWGPQITVSAVWPLFVDTSMVEGMDVGAQRKLGVRLSAQDVADVIIDIVEPADGRIPMVRTLSHSLPRTVHRAVGAQAKALLASSAIGPSWLNRLVNKRLGSP